MVQAASTGKEQATGSLFGKLFPAYDDRLFLESLELFAKRMQANNFPLDWFKGKKCLDVGCGGGRYCMALAGLGAAHCTGVDVGEASIVDARKRAKDMGLSNTEFQVASALDLPFDDASFDAVIFSGVLQHLTDPVKALSEISRVLRPGGLCYMLVYATGGMRWPLIQMLRPVTQRAGFPAMDSAVEKAGLAANKRRTYLDDLFVPCIDFYSWERLRDLLREKGFSKVERWAKGRLDHEENLDAYLADLEGLEKLMSAAADVDEASAEGATLCRNVVADVRRICDLVKSGALTEQQAMTLVIGQGHHRVVAWKD